MSQSENNLNSGQRAQRQKEEEKDRDASLEKHSVKSIKLVSIIHYASKPVSLRCYRNLVDAYLIVHSTRTSSTYLFRYEEKERDGGGVRDSLIIYTYMYRCKPLNV